MSKSENIIIKLILSTILGLLFSEYINSGTQDGRVVVAAASTAVFFIILSMLLKYREIICHILNFIVMIVWKVVARLARAIRSTAKKLWDMSRGASDE